jgi:hypothetical protein
MNIDNFSGHCAAEIRGENLHVTSQDYKINLERLDLFQNLCLL